MAFARRALTVLIAVALAALPLGAATAGQHVPAAKQASAAMHHGHATPHDRDAPKVAVTARQGSAHCKDKKTNSNCCDDESTCADTCLQKCFGQTAVMPAERGLGRVLAQQFVAFATEGPPGWALAPPPPPPRA